MILGSSSSDSSSVDDVLELVPSLCLALSGDVLCAGSVCCGRLRVMRCRVGTSSSCEPFPDCCVERTLPHSVSGHPVHAPVVECFSLNHGVQNCCLDCLHGGLVCGGGTGGGMAEAAGGVCGMDAGGCSFSWVMRRRFRLMPSGNSPGG